GRYTDERSRREKLDAVPDAEGGEELPHLASQSLSRPEAVISRALHHGHGSADTGQRNGCRKPGRPPADYGCVNVGTNHGYGLIVIRPPTPIKLTPAGVALPALQIMGYAGCAPFRSTH